MTLSRNEKDQLVVTFERELQPKTVSSLVKYLRFLELMDGAKKVPQKDIDALADKVKSEWWKKNKKTFLRESRR